MPTGMVDGVVLGLRTPSQVESEIRDWIAKAGRNIELMRVRHRANTCAAVQLIRKATIQRFSYVIAFEKHEQRVLVLAVAHANASHFYWLTRMNP